MLVDAPPLISFSKIGKFDLLEILALPLACTDFVRAEVRRSREPLENLFAVQRLKEIALIDPAQLLEVEQLYGEGLGRGEASSIVLARHKGYSLILDAKRARKKAEARSVLLHSTAEIVIQNIRAGMLTMTEADTFIAQWQLLGEFPLSYKSFTELLS
ncbi:hypothetical protein NDI52_07230 [Leptolyngbya sp. PL-A3]|uniref:hypothetical protein n=1 Tax=Leptolyngbya sp. PL-A3 TaxID=2933911 RepID=UPI0032974AD0